MIMNAKSYYFKFKLSLILSVLLMILVADKIPLSLDDNLQTVRLDVMQLSGINLVNPIFINDTDPNFNWSKTAAENDWCSGSGSWSDPYVIQDITINGNNISNCIDIQNSNKYFTVKNCTVYNSSSSSYFAGITLINVNNSLIFDNNCSFNNGDGIHLRDTYNNTLLHNLAKNNTWTGISLIYSANNTVRNNTLGNNHLGIGVGYCGSNTIIDNNSIYGSSDSPMNSAGIKIGYSHNTTITKNNLFNNTKGTYFHDSSNITLKGNTISNCERGIYTESSNYNITFIDNVINDCDTGMSLNVIQESIVRNNTIFSCKTGIFIQNTDNISIYDNTIINCSSGGINLGHNSYNITIHRNNLINCELVVSSPFDQISTYNITKSNLINGKHVYFYANKLGLTASNFSNPGQIILYNCNNSLISNFTIEGGINLLFCTNSTIKGNTIEANYLGLNLQYCYDSTLFNNTIFESKIGIQLFRSTDCNITENKIRNSYYGVYLFDVSNNTLHENKMRNNLGGMIVYYSIGNNITENSINNSLVAIFFTGSSYNNLFFNDLVNNSEDGILMGSSSNNNTMTGNCFVNNSIAGLRIDPSSNGNFIYNNSFIGNTLNALDNGTNNQWDNGVIGNFWDDYVGYDVNGDGIGDALYNISGLANSVDRFPQIIKLPPQIIIENPLDSAYFSYNPPEINLTVISPYNDIDSIWYSLSNGTYTTNNNTFTGALGKTIWDSLGNGTVTLKFYANNSYGLIGSSEVRVWKDIISPQISIFSPIENQEFTLVSPIYNITILEANVGSVWYTIDNGVNNYTITSFTGTITQIAWDAAPVGPVTIRFYARDDVGNIGTSSVIVTKILSDIPTPPGIPGYNLILVIGIVSVISLVRSKKGSKK